MFYCKVSNVRIGVRRWRWSYMKKLIILIIIIKVVIYISLFCFSYSAELPTNYEYYTSGGIKSGLKERGNYFTLNGKEVRILSGSLHYFRVPQQYWRDRLFKMKAAGLNAVINMIALNYIIK